MKLMLTPIKNGLVPGMHCPSFVPSIYRHDISFVTICLCRFISERHKRVRLACANAWVSLVYAMGPKLLEVSEARRRLHVSFPLLCFKVGMLIHLQSRIR